MPELTDYITRRAILGTFEEISSNSTFLTDRFFPQIDMTTSEVASLRMSDSVVQYAPFVRRGADASAEVGVSDEWRHYRFPLINEAVTVTAHDISDLGPLSEDTIANLIARKTAATETRIRNSIRAMAAEVLFSRQLTFPDRDGNATQDPIEFPVPSDLTDSVSWADPSTAKPFSDVFRMSLVLSDKGFAPDTVVMNGTTFAAMIGTDEYKDKTRVTVANTDSTIKEYRGDGVIHVGNFDGLDYYVMNVVRDSTALIPDGKVLIGSSRMARGILAFGGVSDVTQTAPTDRFVTEANYKAGNGSIEFAVKSAPMPVIVDLNGFAYVEATLS